MMALCGGFCVYAVDACLPGFSFAGLYSEAELAFNLVRHLFLSDEALKENHNILL